jgi:hypothetical protein
MLSYLKTRQFSDSFLAGMRGICVVTGLLGTVIMPLLERRLGLVRAGSWSIWHVSLFRHQRRSPLLILPFLYLLGPRSCRYSQFYWPST